MTTEQTLEQDILLSFHSVHGKKAHISETTQYVAKHRAVVKSTVCTRRRMLGLLPPKVTKQQSQLEIPREITTREALEPYVRAQRPGWLRRHRQERKYL